MKTSCLRLAPVSFALLLLTLAASPIHAITVLTGDHEIQAGMSDTGDLSIEGTLHVAGSTIDFGTTGSSVAAFQFGYHGGLTPPAISFDAAEAAVRMIWRQDSVDKMELNDGNELRLFAPSYNPATPNAGLVRLDPNLPGSGGSAIYVDGNRVLTQADSASFVSSTSGAISGSLSVGGNLTMLGGTVASGTNGYGASYGIALGPLAYANPFGSVAIGPTATAWGVWATSIGSSNIAGGNGSFATGQQTRTGGILSFSAGFLTNANAAGQMVIGVNNEVIPASPSAVFTLTDPAFIIGNGSYMVSSMEPNPSKSNAFLVRFNGDTDVSGGLLVKKSAVVENELTVTGDITTEATVHADKANFTGRVRLEPAGGISMGEFTHDPEEGL